MQPPTATNIRVRSVSDAHILFYAVDRGILPIVTRRLDSEERRAIRSGSVYVWEERGTDSEATGLGIERWTDGIRWGPSRVRDEFLFYHEKELDLNQFDALGTPLGTVLPIASLYTRRDRLVKQTYSVYLDSPSLSPSSSSSSHRHHHNTYRRRKWHLIAYFTQESLDADELRTVDAVQALSTLRVPPGAFSSARAVKGRSARRVSPYTVPAPMPASSASGMVLSPAASSSASAYSSDPRTQLPMLLSPPPQASMSTSVVQLSPPPPPVQPPVWPLIKPSPTPTPTPSSSSSAVYTTTTSVTFEPTANALCAPLSSPSTTSSTTISSSQPKFRVTPQGVEIPPLIFGGGRHVPKRRDEDEDALRLFRIECALGVTMGFGVRIGEGVGVVGA